MSMSNIKKLSGFSVFSILIMATVWNFESAAVNPALAVIMAGFPDEPLTKITFISTIPFITSMIFSVVSGKLADRFDKKKIAVFGLALYGITGMLPGFLTDLNIILFLRLLTGIGVGLVLPIPAMIIAEYYQGKQLEKMNGYMNAVFNVANGIISICVGLLLGYGWQVSFYSFAFIFIVMLFAIVGCPKSMPMEIVAESNISHTKSTIPVYAYKMWLCMILIWMGFAWLLLSLAPFNAMRAILPMPLIGIICAIPGTLNGVAALIYPHVSKYRYGLITVALILFGLAFICMANAFSVGMLVLGCAGVGLGQGVLVPYIITSTAENVPEDVRDRSLGLVQSGIHLGSLITTFLVTFVVGHAVGEPYFFTFNVAAVATLVGAMIFLFVAITNKGKEAEKTV